MQRYRMGVAAAIIGTAPALCAAALPAQGAPGTDIFLVPLERTTGSVRAGTPVNLTARPGYDNQPAFAPDGSRLYYTSIREDAQADIWVYDLASGRPSRLTATLESEYSPTVRPDGGLSVVRVERDSTQRLWAFRLDGTAERPVLADVKPVGYHVWQSGDSVLVYILGSPATLQLAEVSSGRTTVIARDGGRSLHRIPGRHALSFVQRDSAGGWIRAWDPRTGAVTSLVRVPDGAQDFAWTPAGEILMAQCNRLLLWQPGATQWAEVARFTDPRLARITRLAVSPAGDRLALVAEEPRDGAPPPA